MVTDEPRLHAVLTLHLRRGILLGARSYEGRADHAHDLGLSLIIALEMIISGQ
jgi:hypothetical protein